MAFPLFIFSLDRELFAGKANTISLPGADGRIQILPNHAPLISLLKEGEIVIEQESGDSQKLPIEGGVAEVREEKVVVLVHF
ncbi:MAG: hypothetical protein Q8P70_01285 [bacterium]|nr:hypothetical protein [bacterium]